MTATRPQRNRGTLRIYLGAAPGVGKTFAMLNEGRRRHDRGTDVVVGFVEFHGRPHTAEQVGDLEVIPRRTLRVPRDDVRGDGRRRHPAAPAPAGARRRVRPHQRPGLAQREAVAGRRRAARRRHRRHLDGEHPAPRVAERRRRADHRDQAAGDGARPHRAPSRPDRARRHGSRGAAPPDGPRQHLRRRQGRRRARQLLPRRQPVRACASWPCCGSPTGSTTPSTTTASGTASPSRGRRASVSWSRSPGHRRARSSSAGRRASPSGPRAS